MDDKNRFADYWRLIDQHVDSVLSEMALGNVETEKSLRENIESTVQIFNAVEAFETLNNVSPYEWKDVLNYQVIKKHSIDLAEIIVEATNTRIFDDVLKKVLDTEAFRFLNSEPKTMIIKVRDGSIVVFKETWSASIKVLGYLPIAMITILNESELCVYKEGNDLIYTLSHVGPALCWISEKVNPKPKKSVDYYESIKVETLLKYGFSQKFLWLTEVQSVDDFVYHYCDQTLPTSTREYYGLEAYHYVIYYHETGEVLCHAGFNHDEDFLNACEFLTTHQGGKNDGE
jgi:hypothetical protein